MKKIVIHSPGNYEKIHIEQHPDPEPGPEEIVIEVKASGVNFADCLIRMGMYQSAREFVGWPITPGFEVAGIVKEVGKNASRFRKGQRVVAITLFGGYTSDLVVREDYAFPLSEKLSFEEGASIPAVFLTAYYALFELVHPHKNDLMLVHSSAGGVGSTLVQMGKLAGCQVVGVVGSSHKVEYVESLGADLVIDQSTQDLWKEAEKFAPKGFDVILDANGGASLRRDYDHLNFGGKLVVYGFHTMFSKNRGIPNWFKLIWEYFKIPRFNPLYMTNENRSILAFNLSYMVQKIDILRPAMEQIFKWIDEGKLNVPQIKTYPLENAADAQKDLETGQTIGKLILKP